MTNEHYLKQPKPMIEWVLKKKLARNPELIKTLRNTSHPLIRKYRHIIHSKDEDDIYKKIFENTPHPLIRKYKLVDQG